MFQHDFSELLDFCNSLSGKCLIVGDMNVHFDCPQNPCTAKLTSMLDEFCFSQSVAEPTHERGHILDWIVFRPDDNLLSSTSVTHSLTSDHYCVVCELCATVPPDPAVYTDTRYAL